MEQQNVNERFDDIIRPKIVNKIVREKRPPSRFPELRYLWGMTLLGSFIMMMVASVISTLIHG